MRKKQWFHEAPEPYLQSICSPHPPVHVLKFMMYPSKGNQGHAVSYYCILNVCSWLCTTPPRGIPGARWLPFAPAIHSAPFPTLLRAPGGMLSGAPLPSGPFWFQPMGLPTHPSLRSSWVRSPRPTRAPSGLGVKLTPTVVSLEALHPLLWFCYILHTPL